MWEKYQVSFFLHIQLFQHRSLKRSRFPHWVVLAPLLKINWLHVCRSTFGLSIPSHSSAYLYAAFLVVTSFNCSDFLLTPRIFGLVFLLHICHVFPYHWHFCSSCILDNLGGAHPQYSLFSFLEFYFCILMETPFFLHPTVNSFFPEVTFFLCCRVAFSSWGCISLDWVLAKGQDVWITLISPGCSLSIDLRR